LQISFGKTLTAAGTDTLLTSKKPTVLSHYNRAEETVLARQVNVMLSRISSRVRPDSEIA
jgi:hypothetical protein